MDIARLHAVQRRVAAALADQFFVRPVFHQPATIDGDDAIAAPHGRQTMGDDEDRAPLRDALHVVLNDALTFVVQRTGGLVEDQNARIGHQRPGDGDALTLAARKPGAAFADDRVIAFRQLQYEIVGAGELRRFDDPLDRHRRIGQARCCRGSTD